MRLAASQIDRLFDGFVRLLNFTANGLSGNITTAITLALSSAGNGGVSVPLQVAVSGVGVITNVTVPIFDNALKKPLRNADNNEVYGKITESNGDFTLSFFSLNATGTETAYTFSSATPIDFLIVYRFDFFRVPNNFATAYPIGDINLPSTGTNTVAKWFTEKLPVTLPNTVSALTKTPTSNTNVFLHVNGKTENAFGGSGAAFSVNAKNITWNAANAGDLLTSYDVVAFYETIE